MLCSATGVTGFACSCTGVRILRASCSNDRMCSLCSWRRIFVGADFPFNFLFDGVETAFQTPDPQTGRARGAGQAFRPEYQQGHEPTSSSSEKLIPNISQCSRVFADRLFDFSACTSKVRRSVIGWVACGWTGWAGGTGLAAVRRVFRRRSWPCESP